MNVPTRLAVEIALLVPFAFVLRALHRSTAPRPLRVLTGIGLAALFSGTSYALAVYAGWTPLGRAAENIARSPRQFFTIQLFTTMAVFVLVALVKRKTGEPTKGPGPSHPPSDPMASNEEKRP